MPVAVHLDMTDGQVLYRVTGAPQSIAEAAARIGFRSVPAPVLDRVVEDVGLRMTGKPRHEKVHGIISTFRHDWAWTEVGRAGILFPAPSPSQGACQRT